MATKADPSQFQPDKSSSSTDAIKDWCMKPDISSSESMTVIPGVGPATAAAFSKVNIQKTKLSLTVLFVLVLIRPTNLLYQFSHFLCATPLLSLSLFSCTSSRVASTRLHNCWGNFCPLWTVKAIPWVSAKPSFLGPKPLAKKTVPPKQTCTVSPLQWQTLQPKRGCLNIVWSRCSNFRLGRFLHSITLLCQLCHVAADKPTRYPSSLAPVQ
jgi:hypothetical protein